MRSCPLRKFHVNRTWRSSGGITDNDGVVVLSTEIGAEEYLSGFKYIQLFNTDYTGGTPPRHCQISKNVLAKSLGGRGGRII